MKKYVICIIMTIVAVSLVVACGKKEENKDTTANASVENSVTVDDAVSVEDSASSDVIDNTGATEESTTLVTDNTENNSVNNTENNADTTSDKNTTNTTEATTKKPETTTAKKEETTTKKKEETTTAAPKPTKPAHQSGRLKDCELWLISQLYEITVWNEKAQDYVPATIYDSDPGYEKYNTALIRRAAGWENIVAGSEMGMGDPDDFTAMYPDDEVLANRHRQFKWTEKYFQHIIDECDAWFANTSKYGSVSDFGTYLTKKYSWYKADGSNPESIFYNCANPDGFWGDMYEGCYPEWCEEWAYFDKTLQQYNTSIGHVNKFESFTLVKNGYYDDVDAAYHWVQNNCKLWSKRFTYIRWNYNANTNKTTLYLVFGN